MPRAPVIPHCPLHGNINISVHKHWSDNPLLFRALSSPVGVFIDPAQDTSWHPSRTARRASFNSAPSHSSLHPCQGSLPTHQSTPWLDIPVPLPPPSPLPLCNIDLIVGGFRGQLGCIWLPHLVRKLPLCPSPQSANPSFFKIYFNWRIITLNTVMDFAIHEYESAVGARVSPPP